MKSSYPESKIILACLSGPDIGKRFAVERQQVVVGRSTDAELLSEDPDVAPHHVIFRLSENTPSFTTIDGSVVFVDGHPTEEERSHQSSRSLSAARFGMSSKANPKVLPNGWTTYAAGSVPRPALKKFRASAC